MSLYKMNQFLERYTRSKNKIKVQLNLCNYTTKFDLKNATDIDISNFVCQKWPISLDKNEILLNQIIMS